MLTIILTLISLAFVGLVGMAVVKSNTNEHKVTAAAAIASGHLLSYGGKAWVSQNLKTVAIGEEVTYRSDVVVLVPKNTAADVIADEADVHFDYVGQEVPAGNVGGTISGIARGGSANGDTHVLVGLNENIF